MFSRRYTVLIADRHTGVVRRVTDYGAWAKEVLAAVPDLPISFEVLADDVENIRRQALLIASWGKNVYVKVPVTTTTGTPSRTTSPTPAV